MMATDAKGFTLLELLVALAIAGLLLAIVVPLGLHRRDRDALGSSARDMAAALRLARSRAIVANRPTTFLVDVENGFYRPPGATEARAVPAGSHLALYTAEQEQLRGTAGTIRFYPDGSSTGGGITLSLGRDRYEILVDWLTGGVSVHGRSEPAGR